MRTAKEQMAAIKDRVLVRTVNGLPASPMGWVKDGEDHINIAFSAATELGRVLSLRRNRRFLHPLLGSFAGVNNVWFFLLANTPSDELRTVPDHARLAEIVKRNGGERRFVENFRAMVIHSAWVMLLNYPDLMELMAKSSLPFDCYRRISPQAIPERFKFTGWFVEGMNEIRKAIKARSTPNLENLLDRKSKHSKDAYLYGDSIEWITGVPVDAQEKVDFEAFNAESWENYDKIMAQRATQKTTKKPKKFEMVSIDAVPEEVAAPIEAVVKTVFAPEEPVDEPYVDDSICDVPEDVPVDETEVEIPPDEVVDEIKKLIHSPATVEDGLGTEPI